MKQTAVEWLADKMLTEHHSKIEWNRIVEQAKEMEKMQIVKAYENLDFNLEDGEHYYNKTFKQQEQ